MTRAPRAIQLPEFDDLPDPVVTNTRAVTSEALISLVRTAYILCYRDFTGNHTYGTQSRLRWDGGEYAFGRRNTAAWPKLVQTIASVGANPLEFIRAQFYGRANTRPPTPLQCTGEGAISIWRMFCSDRNLLDECQRERENDRRSFYGTMQTYMNGVGWSYDKALRFALGDTIAVYSTPLFRYCVAAANGQPEFADFYFERALLQFLFRYEEYTKVYADEIPVELKQAVFELRRYLDLV
jgi:hypothetical protein